MQLAAVIFLVLWAILGTCIFLNDCPFYGWLASLVEGVIFGFIFTVGTVALITIALLLLATALGFI